MDRSVKSERKTRSMRFKENCEEIPISLIKRGHYVRNPELEINNGYDEDVPVSTRKLRRHTLKEQNRVLSDDEDPVKKHKQSSKTKKNHAETIDNTDIGDQQNIEMPELKQKVKKSKKKKQAVVVEEVENIEVINNVEEVSKTKKKTKRRKTSKQSYERSSVKVGHNEIVKDNMLNVSNLSNESYHSAAGSIQCEITTQRNGAVTELEIVPKDVSSKKSTPTSLKKNKSNIIFDSKVENESNGIKIYNFFNKSMANNKNNTSKIKLNDNLNEKHNYNIKLDNSSEKRKSNEKNNSKIKLDDTYEKPNSDEKKYSKINFNDTYEKRSSDGKNDSNIKFNNKYDKPNSDKKNKSNIKLDDTYEKPNSDEKNNSKIKLDDTYERPNSDEKNNSKIKLDDTYERPNSDEKNNSKINLDDTFEKTNISTTIENNKSMKKRRSSSILLLDASNSMTDLSNTFDNSDKPINTKLLDVTFEKEKLNDTYDYEKRKSDNNNSHISLNSEDSKTQNLLNMTAELIESSNDEISFKNSPKSQNIELPLTPFKREGTYTKDSPPYIGKESPVSMDSADIRNYARTPERRKSLQSPGHTPFLTNKKTVLNVTHSIENLWRSESMEPVPRATKVMFCSPTNQATVSSQIKRKVIKSNMKGSNKSFIFDSSVSELNRSARKRSYTQNDAEEVRSKRSKLEEKKSVERLSRPRTLSATVKASEPSTPSKKLTKTKPDNKVTRTKLPNFTALHQKQFDKMESLDQCQERKARRAKQLLTPTGSVNFLDRISPKEKDANSPSKESNEKLKPSTPSRKSKTTTLTSLNPGYTRFGFKLNTSVNPFSVPKKEDKPNDRKLLPSRTGATTSRREAAKQTVMREKSFTERNSTKRNESRTFIKGVRTNRRFQLQMEMRNVNTN